MSGGWYEDVIDSSENQPPKPGDFIFKGSKFFGCLLWSLSLGNLTHLSFSSLIQGSARIPSVGYLGQIKSVVKRVLFAMPQSL